MLREHEVEFVIVGMSDCDFLGHVGPDLEYPDLIPAAVRLSLGDFDVDVATLQTVIELKEHANRENDRLVLPSLRSLWRVIAEEGE